jgi:transcriptional regulator with XRE-family HTH domain
MYPNLRAEIARQGLNLSDVAEKMGMTLSNLSKKLKGEITLTFSEAKRLKKIVKTDLPLEILFEEAVE